MNEQHAEKRDVIPTASHVLSDGRLVELLHDPHMRKTALMVGSAESVEIVERLEIDDGSILMPMSPKNNLIWHEVVMLPETLEGFGSPVQLASAIEEYIRKYVDLSPEFLKVATSYVLLSWVYDAFNELPYLRFRGDFGTGKTRALAVIGSILYKGFFASGASTVSPIFYILNAFRGSLILDEADFRFSDEKAEMSKILNNGNVAGFPVLRQTMNAKKEFDPKAFQVFGPKIVGSRQSFDDAALESRFLTEDMVFRRPPAHIPRGLPDAQKDEARALRNRLLAYRYVFRHKVKLIEEVDDGERSARTAQIIGPLLSVAPTAEHHAAIIAFATDLDADVKSDRSASLDAALVEVLVALAGTREGPLPVTEISSAFASRVGADADRAITPRYTGFLLRKHLRLRTHRSHGVYSISPSERAKIDFLARRFGVDGTAD